MTGRISRSLLAGLLTAGLLIALVEGLVHQISQRHVEQERALVAAQLVELRARLGRELQVSLDLTDSLVSYVNRQPRITQPEFEHIARIIVGASTNVRNVALAQDLIITHIHPIAGNEPTLGLDYRSLPEQWLAVEHVLETRDTVVGGPYDLVQGGRGFIIRTPIYQERDPGSSATMDLWGMAAIVLDEHKLRKNSNFDRYEKDLQVAMRGKDGRGIEGDLIWGLEDTFANGPILQSLLLPVGSWLLAAHPHRGWSSMPGWLPLARLAGWLLALSFAALMVLLVRTRDQNLQLALHDQLTGLPNRRLLEDRIEQSIRHAQRNNSGFALVYIDLDSFKAINDRHGHHAGDQLLIEVARRLRLDVRESDTVARIGGDEFIMVLPGIADAGTAARKVAVIERQLSQPIAVNQQQLILRASIGMAFYPEDGGDMDSLLSCADHRMYQQKSEHRLQADAGKAG